MQIVIDNEQDIFDLLKKLTKDEVFTNDISFVINPKFNLKVSGEYLNGTINRSLIKVFTTLQESIYKTYAYSLYGNNNISRLTEDEKNALELYISIDKGSTESSLDITSIANNAINKFGDKMSGNQIVGVVSLIALCLTGGYAFSKYLEYLNSTSSDSSTTQLMSRQLDIISKSQDHNSQILTEYIKKDKDALNILQMQQRTMSEVVRATAKEESSVFNGVKLDGVEAEKYVKKKPDSYLNTTIDDIFTIQSIDFSDKSHPRITIESIDSSNRFPPIIFKDYDKLKAADIALLKEAVFSGKQVSLVMTAKLSSNKIKDAEILEIKPAN